MEEKKLSPSTLVLETVKHLNTTGIRHKLGNDWKWTTGMIAYHLPMLIDRIRYLEDTSILVDSLWHEAISAIEAYNRWTSDQPKTWTLVKALADVGVDIEYRPESKPS